MIQIKRTSSDNSDFQKLIIQLDSELRIRDGDDHSFYAQFNKVDNIRNVVIYYHNHVAVGCGAFKRYDHKTVEIKRMFVIQEFRNKGIGAEILKELELWATELNFDECILETGKKQPEAIKLYQKSGYSLISNYGQYANVENSVCMKKSIQADNKIRNRGEKYPGST